MSKFQNIMDKLNPMKNRELNLCPVVRLALASLTLTPAMMAQEEQKAKELQLKPEASGEIFDFKIPAQPLSSSLAEIATQAKVKLSFDKAFVSQKQAPALQGKYSVEQAFEYVLKDSGLKISKMKNGYELIADAKKSDVIKETIKVEGQRQKPNTISSRKFVEPLKSTQTVDVIGSETIEQQGISSLKEVLSNSPGITFRAAEGGAPSGDNLFIRGLSATNDIFVDGMRNNAEQSRDAYNLEQVEVFKGPNSSSFGRGSAGGAINLVTKSPQLDNFTKLSLGVGTDEYWRSTLDSNYILSDEDGIALRFNAMYGMSEVANRDEIEKKSFALNPTISFGLGTNTRFNLGYEHIQQSGIQDNGIPTLAYDSYERNGQFGRSGVDDSNFYGFKNRDKNRVVSDKFSFGFEHDYDETWTLSNQTSIQHTRSYVFGTVVGTLGTGNAGTGAVSADNVGNDIRLDDRTRDTEVISFQNQSLLTGEFETGDFKHDVVFGLDFSWEEFTRYETTSAEYSLDGGLTFDGTTFVNLYDPDVSNIIARGGGKRTGRKQSSKAFGSGLYFGDTIELNDQWIINGMGRIDYYKLNQQDTRLNDSTDGLTTEDWLPSWRFGLTYKPAENGSIYFGIGNSLNPPSSNASNGFIVSSNDSSSSNPNNDPIETRSYELGTKWEFFDAKLNLYGALFQNDVKNDLTAVPGTTPTEYIQTGKKRIQGLSLGASGKITDNWTILLGYTFMKSKIDSLDEDEDGQEVPFLPDHSATIWSQHQITKDLSFGIGAQYSGNMNYDDTGTAAPDDASYILWNAMASYNFSDNLSVQLNVQNLFDEKYISAGSTSRVLPGTGRTILLNLTYEF